MNGLTFKRQYRREYHTLRAKKFISYYHEKTQVMSTVSISSRGDFCFAVVAGVIILLKRFQRLSSHVSSASGKCCYFN